MRMGGRPGAPRALAVPTGPLGSAGPPQTAANIFSCILERLTENSVYDLPVWHIFSNQTYKPKIIKSGMAYHISRSNQRGRPN